MLLLYDSTEQVYNQDYFNNSILFLEDVGLLIQGLSFFHAGSFEEGVLLDGKRKLTGEHKLLGGRFTRDGRFIPNTLSDNSLTINLYYNFTDPKPDLAADPDDPVAEGRTDLAAVIRQYFLSRQPIGYKLEVNDIYAA